MIHDKIHSVGYLEIGKPTDVNHRVRKTPWLERAGERTTLRFEVMKIGNQIRHRWTLILLYL